MIARDDIDAVEDDLERSSYRMTYGKKPAGEGRDFPTT